MSDSEISNSEIRDARSSTASGKYAIIAIATLAIGGALFNWWYQRDLHRRSLEFWGASRARLIVQAPEVEALRLVRSVAASTPPLEGEPAQETEQIEIGGQVWKIIERRRIDTPTQAPGSSHVRSSLVNDKSIAWNEPRESCQPDWQYGLRFREKDQTETILIDLNCPRLALVGTDLQQSIRPMVPALKEFFGEQFSTPPR